MRKIINDFVKAGYSMAYMERALGLPMRTMARWKKGSYAKADLALMKVLKAFPWMIKVADEQFKDSQRAMMHAGIDAMCDRDPLTQPEGRGE